MQLDFHKVLSRYADKSISGPIYLSTSIAKIDRSGTHPIITYHNLRESNPRIRAQPCSAVVLAFPPTLSALQYAGLDLTEDERRVFAPVGIHSFYSAAVQMKTPHSTKILGMQLR
jgi:hypothetical protein